ncbi:hypothetical protein IFM89_025491 [Coptis chinensis]|uniref:Uncharacterized protein n=1 Tax=Coptis chinensis TaxID=261450 RepID=A0A835I7Y3_9MAGN|nr:hypothetical protein IFM89_025491 [Coptis chinensis]
MTGGKVGLDSYSCAAKVHHAMCKELIKLVDRISEIVLSIESAQPRCREGIEALCSLSLALEKAKLIIQHCTESSKLYLAITGDAIKLRCERLQNAFGQSLTQIQSLVPLLLAARVSRPLLFPPSSWEMGSRTSP